MRGRQRAKRVSKFGSARLRNNLTSEELLKLLADCAERGAEVAFLTGSELSLMTAGILTGDSLEDRGGASGGAVARGSAEN